MRQGLFNCIPCDTDRIACDHPSLVTSALGMDMDAIETKEADVKGDQTDRDQADDLADLLGGLGVDKAKTCEMCFCK